MGPWLCSHGNLALLIAILLYAALQWGRGCVATEISARARCGGTVPHASMGPWLCSHGNATKCCSLRIAFTRFNGAVAV